MEPDELLARVAQVWAGESAAIWVESANVFLGGAPVDGLAAQGSARILKALDAELWGRSA